MLNAKRLIEMARKWQKAAALGRRRITSSRNNANAPREKRTSPLIASRGHLFVYTTDARRFMIPIAYLSNDIFRELFRMSEEEFGLPTDRPITLPCDASCMEYIISSLMTRKSKDEERTLLASIIGSQCTTSCSLFPQGHSQEQMVVCGY